MKSLILSMFLLLGCCLGLNGTFASPVEPNKTEQFSPIDNISQPTPVVVSDCLTDLQIPFFTESTFVKSYEIISTPYFPSIIRFANCAEIPITGNKKDYYTKLKSKNHTYIFVGFQPERPGWC